MKQISKTVSSMSNEGRNQYVVSQITWSLLELMREQQIDQISIRQICEKAQVGRASFYRNFDSKEEVIRRHLNALSNEWKNRHEGISQEDLVEAIFEHYSDNRELFILLYKQNLAHLSLQNLKDSCGPKAEQSNIIAYSAAFLSHGIYGWIEEWFLRGLQETPKEMAELCLNAQRRNF